MLLPWNESIDATYDCPFANNTFQFEDKIRIKSIRINTSEKWKMTLNVHAKCIQIFEIGDVSFLLKDVLIDERKFKNIFFVIKWVEYFWQEKSVDERDAYVE